MDLKLFQKLLPEDDCLLDLYTSASIGCEERVREIIENSETKSVVNQQNSSGWTPLMYGACCANLRVVALLLEEEALTDLKNNLGQTALILASKCGSTDVVSVLLDNSAYINDRDYKGWSALSYAAAFGHRSVVQLLTDNGAITDIVGKENGLTPLMLSSAAGHERIVKDLLKLGVNASVQSKSGETARSLAIQNGHLKVKNMVEEHMHSQRKLHLSSWKSPDPTGFSNLQNLLTELQLSKYYPILANHEIDLNTFLMLNDNDLKEIGIQILGPRKKMCLAIAQWHECQLENGIPDSRTFCNKLLMENQQLHQIKDEFESALYHELEERKAAEHNLNEGIKTLKNFKDTVQRTMAYTVLLEDKLKQNQIYLRKLLYSTPDMHWKQIKNEVALPLLDRMEKLMDDIHHHSLLSLQQTDFKEQRSNP